MPASTIHIKFVVEKRRSRHHVLLIGKSGPHLEVRVSMVAFPDRRAAQACVDELYRALQTPF